MDRNHLDFKLLTLSFRHYQKYLFLVTFGPKMKVHIARKLHKSSEENRKVTKDMQFTTKVDQNHLASKTWRPPFEQKYCFFFFHLHALNGGPDVFLHTWV